MKEARMNWDEQPGTDRELKAVRQHASLTVPFIPCPTSLDGEEMAVTAKQKPQWRPPPTLATFGIPARAQMT